MKQFLAFLLLLPQIGNSQNLAIYCKDSLVRIEHETKTSSDEGFKLWMRHGRKVDSIMGKDYAEKNVCTIIRIEDSTVVAADRKAIEGLPVYRVPGGNVFYGVPDSSAPQPEFPNWDSMYASIKSAYGRYYADRLTKFTALNFYKLRQIHAEYTHCLVAYYIAYPEILEPATLNAYAWDVFKYSGNKHDLLVALKWSSISIDQTKQINFDYEDTNAELLYKLNRRKEAIAKEEKLLLLADSENQKASIQNTVDKMKKGDKTWMEP